MPMPSQINVLHVGLGPIGLAAVRLTASRPGWLRTVAAVDPAAHLVGRPLDEIADGGADRSGPGAAPAGRARGEHGLDLVRGATGYRLVGGGRASEGLPGAATAAERVYVGDRIPAAAPGAASVAIHATVSSIDRCEPQLLELIAAGWHVVSSCEELSYPWLAHPEPARRIDAAARAAGLVVVGAGVNPGYAMDLLPVVLTGAARRVDRVLVTRVQDAGTRRVPLQRKVGAGLAVDEFARLVEGGLVRHVGLRESAQAICAALAIGDARVTETIEPVIARARLDSALGPIEAGRVAGVHQVASASAAGREAVRLDLLMAVGAEAYDEIVIEGDPGIRMRVAGGLHGDVATEAVLVNTIAPLLHARPGLRVMTELTPPRPAPPAR